MLTFTNKTRISVFYKSLGDSSSSIQSDEIRSWPFSPISQSNFGHIGDIGTTRRVVDDLVLNYQLLVRQYFTIMQIMPK